MFDNLLARPNNLPFRRLWWKTWYNNFGNANFFGDLNIVFMNYGYADLLTDAKQLTLNKADDKEHYCLKLYHHVANAIPLEGLDVLEVGCGRGGGSSYIQRYLKPKKLIAVDFSKNNIKLCHQNHSVPQLQFSIGDAESLTFDDSSFDSVVNVESSHCYGHMERFFAEVFRVLRPNGHFLFADFRPKEAIETTENHLEKCGFEIVKKEIITPNVLKAMDLEEVRKNAIIQNNIPKVLHGLARWFVASKGTPVHQAFQTGKMEYLCYILRKKHN
jgi:ubiquinone/menaquinone biosynthesis C-methylase UbiE